ncbi:hypothetical protein LV84_02329 [Algoriphagus ratkowskyi]|uniref:Uncharacterized protein n=1 Tax=Algoriphagus ratkowskyi TaxID=57028 RepID=A0A2W7R9Z9_9BACT|nr:DUF5995 family protein [Algoriphagus ratkowskyi]PZX55966.1 hypothetical protein LV84_02329 [Algoriphagus ratkowskyi]TXD77221.1 hypothetical protein ESW18_13075 [Algoriphagus ratkowskyi]
MKTIDEVLVRMDQIVEECKITESRIGYFAILYRQVTRRIRDGIITREFEDNPRMERLDVLFAGRFINAYNSWRSGQKPSESWFLAFEEGKANKHLVLQHLLLGINAHINLDLGVSAADTMGIEPIAGIQSDFNKINAVLAELVDGVKSNISKVSPIFGWLIPLVKGRDEMLLNFSIQLARDGAWKYAGEYYDCEDRLLSIQERDVNIAKLANRLINPGKFLLFVVKMVGFAEWKSVSHTMDQLDVMVQQTKTS